MLRTSVLIALAAVLLATPVSAPAADPPKPVDYDRDVKPIFAKHCASCHGPDKQKSGLRLDRRTDALAGGDGGKVIVSGKAADSSLIKMVMSEDPGERMPPKGARLSAAEVETLRAWIDQGATGPNDAVAANPADWWSFKPLAKFAVPGGANPIDHFVRAKLIGKGLTPSKEADRRTLIRRLYFDLIGLPPTPEEVDQFINNKDANAYEQLVDKLLASPHYGERWARHWLDIVHFGETHGYDKDQPRPNAWPYRDYVIRALNSDKPYARFVQEQVAGDVLFPGTVDGIEALGFLSAGPWDLIGHIEVPESKTDGKIARHLDRDDFVSNTIGTFMGLTVHCAQCHNHKFDPITQEDYYKLQAVFAAIDRVDRVYDLDPQIGAKRAELEAKKKLVNNKITAVEEQARKAAGGELLKAEKALADALKPAGGGRPGEYGYHSQLSAKQDVIKWVQIDLGDSIKLDRVILKPCHDDFNNIGAGFGFPVRFKVELSDDPAFKTAAVISDSTAADVANPGTAPQTAKADGKSGRYLRVTATKLAPRQNDYILALAEVEALDAAGANRARGKPVTAPDSIEAAPRWRKANLTDGLAPPPAKATPADIAALEKACDALIQRALGDKGAAELAALRAESNAVGGDIVKLGGPRRSTFVGAVHTGSGNFVGTGASGKPRPIYLLPRGDITKPSKEVAPGAIAAIPGVSGEFNLAADRTEGERRAALAKWLTDANNPLAWRVMANRVWQFHFGRGIVDSPNDFGKMGQLPTHPELLDYLAAELRDHQSLKKLHKSILMSATYKQTSASDDKSSAIDGSNLYLWRQNRRKLEAEAVRDSILAVAGKLDLTPGGPSFKDFVVEKPEHSPHYQYHLHDPEDVKAHRRAVYRFVVRSKQQPFLAALDCADPSLAVEKRNETQTPQQALALLNNKLAVAMAKHFATRVEKMGLTDPERVTAAVRLAFGRDPTAKELDALTNYTKDYGLANTCRVILNLNEFVFID